MIENTDGPVPSTVLRQNAVMFLEKSAWFIPVPLCSQALVYVSTAYSQCPHCEIREEVYPVPLDYQRIFEGNLLDEETANRVW